MVLLWVSRIFSGFPGQPVPIPLSTAPVCQWHKWDKVATAAQGSPREALICKGLGGGTEGAYGLASARVADTFLTNAPPAKRGKELGSQWSAWAVCLSRHAPAGESP